MKVVLISFLSSLIRFLIKSSPPAVANKVKVDLLEKLDVYNNSFTTQHSRPKNSLDCSNKSIVQQMNFAVALVIQGPIIEEENFTLESIRLYKKLFMGHLIIVSTWEDTDQGIIERLKQEEVILVLSKRPDYPGPLNINLQIESSKSGVLKAQQMGAEFVYKTRTDQRIHKNLTHFLIGLQRTFPTNSESMQTMRLMACSFTTLKFRPYGIGDMLMFGHISDMLAYWDSEFDSREIQKAEYESLSIIDYAKVRLAETYLCTNFLQKKGYPIKWTLEDSWKVYSEIFCIVDAEMFDLFWFKYDWRAEKRFEYYKSNTMQCLKFSDWLEIRNNFKHLSIDESILNRREGEQIYE